MAGKFDSPLKWLMAHFPYVFLQLVGIVTSAPIRFLNVEQTVNVSSQADGILLVEEDPPYAVHFEFDSTRVPNGLRRLLQYNAIAAHLHGVPVLSVLVLLRPEADSPDYTGEYRVWIPGHAEPSVTFHYLVIRLWELDPLLLLENAGTIPLAAVANVKAEDVPALLEKAEERLRGLSPDLMRGCLTQMGLLLGLRFGGETVKAMLERFTGMKESSFYQEIIKEGRELGLLEGKELGLLEGKELGLLEGRLQAKRDSILEIGQSRWGDPSYEIEQKLSAINDLGELSRLLKRTLVAESWDEMLDSE